MFNCFCCLTYWNHANNIHEKLIYDKWSLCIYLLFLWHYWQTRHRQYTFSATNSWPFYKVTQATRSQAVARIADRTASQQDYVTTFRRLGLIIRKSDSNNGCSGRRPVRWPETTSKQRSRPRSLSGKIICAPARHSSYKAAYTKFEVSSSSSFGDMFDRTPKIVGVTWPRPRPLSGKLFVRLLGIPNT